MSSVTGDIWSAHVGWRTGIEAFGKATSPSSSRLLPTGSIPYLIASARSMVGNRVLKMDHKWKLKSSKGLGSAGCWGPPL